MRPKDSDIVFRIQGSAAKTGPFKKLDTRPIMPKLENRTTVSTLLEPKATQIHVYYTLTDIHDTSRRPPYVI
jgi:hypothetical protein